MSSVFKLKRPKMREADVQSTALAMLRKHPRVAWVCRTNTGAMPMEHNGKRRFVRFGVPGWPDLTGQLTDGRFLAIECKAPGKKPSADQRAFLETIGRNGGVGFWISDPSEITSRLM